MTTAPRDRLFALLPALYRIADVPDGELQRLLGLIGEQAELLREDTHQLWDDFFIETCQDWAIPYIGDLVGTTPLREPDRRGPAATAEEAFTDLAGPDLRAPGVVRTRADVARTIGYRRRKGTPAMLETLARDVTGWDAHVVEFMTLLRWNQHLEHLRLDAPGCADLRRPDVGRRVGGAWDVTPHTVDVRPISQHEGWHNLPNLGFFFWRLRAFRRTSVTPRQSGAAWRLTFSPLGDGAPLFSAGRRRAEEFALADEPAVEAPIRPSAFAADLRAAGAATETTYYGAVSGGDGSLQVEIDGIPLPATQIACTNLDGWGTLAQPTGTTVRVDIARGRLVIPDGLNGRVTVSHHRGFSAPMGGGEYDRSRWLVAGTPTASVSGGGTNLQTAISNRVPAAAGPTIIKINDSATYEITAPLTLAAGEALVLQAAASAVPHVLVALKSATPAEEWAIDAAGANASLTLGGLVVEGAVRVDGDLERLRLLHTTLVPDRSIDAAASPATKPSGASVVVAATSSGGPVNRRLQVQIAFSITGALRVPRESAGMLLLDSIVDGVGAAAVEGAGGTSGPPAHVERCTLLGASRFLKIDLASETIFAGPVTVARRQGGCMRFCYIPVGSETPQQYRCQPSLEVTRELDARRKAAPGNVLPPGTRAAVEAEVSRWLVPGFGSVAYGRPAYAQLRRTTPNQIRAGGDDGGEMGAFAFLQQPRREANLRLRLDEYLPVGLDAGLIYVT